MGSSWVQAIDSVTGNFVKTLLKLTLPVPLSYCDLVIFFTRNTHPIYSKHNSFGRNTYMGR